MIKTKSYRPNKFELLRISMIYRIKSVLWLWIVSCSIGILLTIWKCNTLHVGILIISVMLPIFITVRLWFYYSSDVNKRFFLNRYYEFDNETVTERVEDGTVTSLKVDTLIKTIRKDDYCLLYITPKRYLHLPYTIFENDEDLKWVSKEVFDKVERNTIERSRIAVSTQETTLKKPVPKVIYYFCVLFLIPLVGAFVGFVILLLGIVKYRNVFLAMVGGIGILITVAVYSSLYYYGFIYKSTSKDEAMVNLTQTLLRNDIDGIEMFKVKTGHYPERLDQIIKKGAFYTIYDPLLNLSLKKKSDRTFYYQLTDDGYTLFSVGFDRIPYTLDDIYPKLTNEEQKTFGFRKITTNNISKGKY